MRRTLYIALACALGISAIGCGEAGVSSGATVTVYVSGESLCKGARHELNSSSGRAGGFQVRMICLDDPGTLAATGANARRATEDSSTVAYIGESNTIVDTAGIAQISTGSGRDAMAFVLGAIRQADENSNLREVVLEEVG